MKAQRSSFLPGVLLSLPAAAGASFILYCEKFQFLPLRSKTVLGGLGLAFLAALLLFSLLSAFFFRGFRQASPKEKGAILLTALILSVCVMVWFPVPQTGLYPDHSLEIRALADEDGNLKPVTLTWLHREDGDISLLSVLCEGSCTFGTVGPVIEDRDGRIRWQGKTGNRITLEFESGSDQGTAQISWDGLEQTVFLGNAALDRLSFDFSFPQAAGLPGTIAVWLVSFLLSLFAITAALKLLPSWSVKALGIGAFICFVIFRVLQFRTVQEPLFFIDSESYLGMANFSIAEILRGTEYCYPQYWYCIARPFFIPLVYKLCRLDPHMITVVQLIISLCCWGFFAQCSTELCRSDRGKKASLILSLGLGCVPNVTRWDAVIMSESLSLSAALLLMGSLFRLTAPASEKRWKPLPAVCTALSALLYAQSRDSAVWIVILIAVLLLCISFSRKNRRVIFLLCTALAAVCWYSFSITGGRWEYPFENVLFNRILRDPQGEQFFIRAEMPMPARIEELYGVEHMMGSELFNSEEMAPLREWIRSDGLKTYIRYLLNDPLEALRMTWYAGFEMEAFEQIGYTFAPAGFRPLLPDSVSKFFSCNIPGILAIGLGLFGLFMAFREKGGERFVFPVLFILSAYILCTGVFIADEYELARHSMVIILMMKAALWALISELIEVVGRR